MKKILIKKNSKEVRILNQFLNDGFGNFRLPTQVILNNKHLKPYLFKDGNKNVGVMVVCQAPHVAYLDLFVVNNKIRSKGYGSKLMNEFAKIAKDKKRILAIELVDPKSKESDDRKRRRRFYFKNKYKYTGKGVIYFKSHPYELLSNKSKITQKDLKEITSCFVDAEKTIEFIEVDEMFHVKHIKKTPKTGVIFDFNGTLFDDDKANATVWTEIMNKYSNKHLTIEDRKEIDKVVGHSKDRTYVKNFMNYFGYKYISNEEADEIWIKKELLYRTYCREHKMNKLAEGTKELTSYLKKNDIPYSIASMAPKMNFDFYFRYTDIGDYFNSKEIIYDCNKYERKNEMYIDAAKLMNVPIDKVIVIEDSPASINEALSAGAKKIIYKNVKKRKLKSKFIIQEVNSLKEINKKLFK